jgi:hypothetical protein
VWSGLDRFKEWHARLFSVQQLHQDSAKGDSLMLKLVKVLFFIAIACTIAGCHASAGVG